MKKRITSIVLITIMLISMLAFATVPAAATDVIDLSLDTDMKISELFDKYKDDIKGQEIGNICLNNHTLTLDKYICPYDDYGIKYLGIFGGTVTTSEDMEDQVCFDIYHSVVLESVTFENCNCCNLFRYFACWTEADIAFRGVRTSDCTFKDCSFTGNGGAFYFDFKDYNIGVWFQRTNFINCHTSGYGSVIYFQNVADSQELKLGECNFINCSADCDGGAIYINDYNIDFTTSTTDFYGNYQTRSLFYNCSAGGDGGAIFDNYGYGTIQNCIFYGCHSSGGYGGGAVLIDEENRTVKNCEFYGNSTDGQGSAIWFDDVDCTVDSCIFEANSSQSAYYSYYENTVKNCTFANVFNFEGTAPKLESCTVYNLSSYSDMPIRRFSSENYNNGDLVRGDSADNPILIKTFADLQTMTLNIDEEASFGSTEWIDKYYRLETNVSGVYLKSYMKDNHFNGNGHTIYSRLTDSVIMGKAPGLTEQGLNGFTKVTAATGFTLSGGNWWIIGVGAAVILGGAAAIVISKKKKAAVAEE